MKLPNTGLKRVPSERGSDLLLLRPDGQLVTVATVYRLAGEPALSERLAQCLAASMLLYDALGRHIDELQPEGWDETTIGVDAANIWRATLRAHCYANGTPIPHYLRHDLPEVSVGP